MKKLQKAALLLYFSIFICRFSFGAALDVQFQFDQANEAYTAQDYSRAISLYQGLVEKGINSGDLYYNLGNACFRSGRMGQAVISYLTALRLTPRNPDLIANARYVMGKRIDRIEPSLFSRVRDSLLWGGRVLNLQEIWILAATLYGIFFFTLVLHLRKTTRFRKTLSGVLLFLNLYFLPVALAKTWQERGQITGVLVSPVTTIYSEPTSSSVKLFELHEGVVVVVKETRGEFQKIELEDGKKGWTQARNIQEVGR